MTDHRFFDRAGPYSLDELAALSGARLWGESDGKQLFSDVAPLETAGPEDVTFLDNRKYVDAFVRSRAGAAFIDERFAERAPAGMALLVTAEPYKAFARAAQAFYPAPPVIPRRAPSAIIDPERDGPGVMRDRGACRDRGRCAAWRSLPDRRHTVIGPAVELGEIAGSAPM
jgi:UDP-3-O-[3-hydroxymyristoyl] glucosamine N-acyltransferase